MKKVRKSIRMKKLLMLLLAFIGIFTMSSCQSGETLVVYTEAGFAPFEYQTPTGIDGVDIDIMNKVGEKLGRRVKFENVQFDAIIENVSKGTLTNVGAAGLSVTPERAEKVAFSKEYYEAKLYVIYNKENASKIDSFSKVMTDNEEGVYWGTLNNSKGIGVQPGTTADMFLSDEIAEGGSLEGMKPSNYSSLSVGVNDIGKNIDYIIIDELPAKKLVSGNDKLACLPLYYPGASGEEDIIAADKYAIAVTKGEDELLNAINSVLDELMNDITTDKHGLKMNGIDRLVEKHLNPSGSNFFRYLGQGFINTVLLSVIAALIGLVLGGIIAVIKVLAKDNKYLKIPAAICNVYTTIIRGTPVALQLFLMVFAIFAIPGFKPFAVVLTFGLNSSAYVSENIRAGIMSVDKGQMEAGRALGLSHYKTMVKVVFPQAIKNVIPSIGNELIALVKETAIVSMVGATIGTLTFDLNAATQAISAETANYLAAALMSGVLYLIIVYGITLLIKLFERRYAQGDKR